MSTITDAELLQRLQQKDGTALEELYERYASLTYSLALQITKEPALAQEVVQDTFTKIWVAPELYSVERGRFSSWLLTVTRNLAIDALRQRARKNRFSVVPPLQQDDALHASHDVSGAVAQKELAAAVRASLHRLKPEQLAILQLAYWEGYALSEVAERLRLPLGTVKSRLHAALKTLRKHLQEWEEERR
ncbi:RNA polymerase sigma factor [Effusibacillus pohliae]|uniref:RNA polymerase sigma factor n=1 Tax=Effusibacillus pohliae TaxID=232270 RepID=UPI000379CD09|nr:sigma-70 family RNA polymerase sigma factor [Effusibacillus pohliae]